jgi:hypothetical protein
MHTARQLSTSQFLVTHRDAPSSREELLPDWAPHDRLGVVVTEPFGAVGASHLIQLAITLFYDARPNRRAGRLDGTHPDAVYPEIYLFHVGGAFGDHSALDFWPARKEVSVEADALAVLDAINDRAITRLAVPEGEPSPVEHEWKEPAAARERIVSAFAYSPSGRVTAADWKVRGLDRRTEVNPANILDPERRYAGARIEPEEAAGSDIKRVWRLRTEERRNEALSGLDSAQRSRTAIRDDRGLATESYRQVTVDEALFMLV